MEGWPDDAKHTMTKVAKIIGDAVNSAPCEKCRTKDGQIRDLKEQVNIGYFDREVCIPELQDENKTLRSRLALAEKVVVEARIYLYGPSNGSTGPLRAALDALKEG